MQEITLGVISDHARHDALALYNSYYGAVNPRGELPAQADPGVVIAGQHQFDDRLVELSLDAADAKACAT